MKSFLIFVKLFTVFCFCSSEEDKCKTWPSELTTLKDCCHLPQRYLCSQELSCVKECNEENSRILIESTSTSDNDLIKMKTCVEDCFVNLSNLVSEDKSLNKVAAGKLYHISDYISPSWTIVINDAVTQCEFGSSESLSANLATFFHCVDETLAKNCLNFKVFNKECEKTVEHFQACRDESVDCKKLPNEPIAGLINCCHAPIFFSNELYFKCYESCGSTEYFQASMVKCSHECILVDSKLKKDKGIDFVVLKQLLLDKANKTVDWASTIDDAVQFCEDKINGEFHLN